MTDGTQELDEILEKVRYAAYYADYHANHTQEHINSIIAEHVAEQRRAILDWHNKQTNEAIHGFHGFVMEADIIRPETDQAFNYGRLHRAIDDYIAERNKLNKSNGDVR